MDFILKLIYFILILGVIILVHELGHFMWAKIFKIYVYEFSIGMGPKLLTKKGKNGETSYCLRAIPIGGFVQLAGEEVEEDTNIPKNRRLQDKPIWQRFLTMFCGAGNNFIFALLLLFSIGLIWGAPNTKPILSDVDANSPAAVSGLEKGDYVRKINNKNVTTIDDIAMYLELANKEKVVNFEVKKANGKVETYKVQAEKEKKDDKVSYRFGIGLSGEREYGLVASVKYTFVKTGALFKQMFVVLGNLFTGGLSVKSLSGPVGIFNLVGDQAKTGIANVIYLIAFLSINVGFINLLPIPAFDGGRILFLIIEKIKGSPIKASTENLIHNIGFLLLMALMLYITFNDIIKLF